VPRQVLLRLPTIQTAKSYRTLVTIQNTARWNSEICKSSALIRPNETLSPAIARLADLQERIAHNERRINTVLSDFKKTSNNLLTQQDVETAMTTFDPIWESMTLRDQIRLLNMIVKRVDYDGESGRVTITFSAGERLETGG
jgi:site-specific DNA recombinase